MYYILLLLKGQSCEASK